MDDTSEQRRVAERLRGLDPVAGRSHRYLDAEAILEAVSTRRTSKGRRHGVTMVLAGALAVLVLVALAPTGTSPSRVGSAIGLAARLRVVAPEPEGGYAVNGGSIGAPTVDTVPVRFVFRAGTGLSVAGADEAFSTYRSVYAVASPPTTSGTAALLAKAFGVPTSPRTTLHTEQGADDDVVLGATGGPSLAVVLDDGVLRWSYVAAPSRSAPTAPGLPVPPPSHSVTVARSILHRLDVGGTLAGPILSGEHGKVLVRFNVQAAGHPTDLQTSFLFGAAGNLEAATGVLVRLTSSGTYGVLTPRGAVGVLSRARFCDSARGHAAGVVTVVIDHATAELATFPTGLGRSVLVPVWRLSGRAFYEGSRSAPSRFLADVVALRASDVRVAHPSCTVVP